MEKQNLNGIETTLTFQESQVLKEIKQYALGLNGEIFSFEDLVLYSDYTEFHSQLETILKSLNDKGFIEYSNGNKYGIIKL